MPLPLRLRGRGQAKKLGVGYVDPARCVLAICLFFWILFWYQVWREKKTQWHFCLGQVHCSLGPMSSRWGSIITVCFNCFLLLNRSVSKGLEYTDCILCREISLPPAKKKEGSPRYHIKLYTVVRFQFWSSGKYWVTLSLTLFSCPLWPRMVES